MNITRFHKLAALSGAVILTPIMAPVVSAAVDLSDNPADWGPALELICDDPAAAAALGYNVISGGAGDDTIFGTPMADAIYSWGGDDSVNGLGGPDLLCLGEGNDKGRGANGFDAVFGEEGYDRIQGNPGNDYLDGGTDYDTCVGGAGFDVPNACEAWTQ